MYYAKNRYYSPSRGGFNRVDPIRDGHNWYGYCNGDPVNNTDPWGLARRKINNGQVLTTYGGPGYNDHGFYEREGSSNGHGNESESEGKSESNDKQEKKEKKVKMKWDDKRIEKRVKIRENNDWQWYVQIDGKWYKADLTKSGSKSETDTSKMSFLVDMSTAYYKDGDVFKEIRQEKKYDRIYNNISEKITSIVMLFKDGIPSKMMLKKKQDLDF